MRSIPSLFLCAVVSIPGGSLAAQDLQLGTIDFPNSGAAEAQADFILGTLLLHSFEYQPAAAAFKRAQAADPDFALAYWGEAMTYNHPLWNERDRERALAALERLGPTPSDRRAQAPTDREQLFLDAVEALWADKRFDERLSLEETTLGFPGHHHPPLELDRPCSPSLGAQGPSSPVLPRL